MDNIVSDILEIRVKVDGIRGIFRIVKLEIGCVKIWIWKKLRKWFLKRWKIILDKVINNFNKKRKRKYKCVLFCLVNLII